MKVRAQRHMKKSERGERKYIPAESTGITFPMSSFIPITSKKKLM
jgi:hypothetical protein